VPPKRTAVAPVKLVPVMITEVPAPPDVGLNPLIVGADVKVKRPAAGSGAARCDYRNGAGSTGTHHGRNLGTGVDSIGGSRCAAKAHRRSPGEVGPGNDHRSARATDVGLNPLIVGADVKVNVPLLVAVPPGVTTETVPVVPVPTTAVIWVLELTV